MATRSRPISSTFLFLKAMALFVFWIFLSASFEWTHLGLGLIFSFAVAWVNSGHSPFVPKFRLWLRILLYLPWLFYKIIQSSLNLSRLILHPALPITPQLISVESKLRHHAAVVLFGNSLTLTPGTITAEVDRNNLIVHSMDKNDDVAIKQIETKIAEIFKDEDPDL
ncbi:MAG: ABC transporter permease [Nitrospinae bacterium CG22_combo_CG10-13_8_21_14_all_47_10]|nr:MAG: ABC transporter permease [Nitrospinae bacterium CG22_combo_CG10-13_8_21_14_all_47_10]